MVIESRQPSPGLLKQAGVVPGDLDSLAALKREIADYTATQYPGVHAAVVAAGSSMAVGAGHGWEINLADTFGAGFAVKPRARVALVVNDPRLEGEPPEEWEPPETTHPKWTKVYFVPVGGDHDAPTSAQCRSGWETIVALPMCGYGSGAYDAYATDIGTVTLRKVMHKGVTRTYRGPASNWGDPRCQAGNMSKCHGTTVKRANSWREVQFLLNGALIGSNGPTSSTSGPLCLVTKYHQADYWIHPASGSQACFDNKPAGWVDGFGGCAKADVWSLSNVFAWTDPIPVNRICGVPVETP